MIQYLLIYFI